MKKWIVMATLRHAIRRHYERFDRERSMIKIRGKMLPILLLIKVRIRKRIRNYGNVYRERERKYFRDATNCMYGGCLRAILRERSKQVLLAFLQNKA